MKGTYGLINFILIVQSQTSSLMETVVALGNSIFHPFLDHYIRKIKGQIGKTSARYYYSVLHILMVAVITSSLIFMKNRISKLSFF